MSEPSAIVPPAHPIDDAGSDPASSDELWTRAGTLALLGGFGLGALAAGVGQPAAWPVVALAVGILYKRNWVAGSLGLILAAIGLAVALAPTAPSPPTEGFAFTNSLVLPIGIAILAVIGPLVVHVGHRLGTGGRVVSVLGASAAVGGLIAMLAVGATAAMLAATPATSSFDVPLPAGWRALGKHEQRSTDDPAVGVQYTALRGDAGVSAAVIATTATIGVSVFDLAPSASCPDDTQGWGTNSPVYRGTLVSQKVVSLPAGTASHEIRAFDPPGSTIDVFGFSRVRRVGLTTESLCYVLAIRSPAGAPVSPVDVEAIAQGIRFR
jgi:hypothetical protein